MNKLLATLVAGTFAVVSTGAVAQTLQQDIKKDEAKMKADLKAAQSTDKAKKFAEQEKQLQDISKADQGTAQQKANVERSKMDPRTKAKYDEKAAQALSTTGTNPDQAKANVAASKAQGPREKMPDIKKLSKEQRAELLRQLQKESTP
jgi:hypothetical protein